MVVAIVDGADIGFVKRAQPWPQTTSFLSVMITRSVINVAYPAKVVNCPEGNHNWFRISRVLVSLRLLGLMDEARRALRKVLL